jgi:hypothetical protein
MRLRSVLPANRWLSGRLWLEDDDGVVLLGPYPCRGKADGAIAAWHGNPSRDPVEPFGDHPTGEYVVSDVVRGKLPLRTYGPYFFLLDPVGGQALEAEEAERRGLAIHGDDPNDDGSLRATEGCLRVANKAIADLAILVRVGMTYRCEEGETA